MTELGYRFAATLARRLPRATTDALADLCGDLYVASHPGRARAVRRNLARAGMEVPDPRLTYRAFARAVRDFLAAGPVDARVVSLDPETQSHLAVARAEGGPTVLLSGHFGPWERALTWIAGELGGVAALAAPHRRSAVERYFVGRRAAGGVHTLRCDRPALAALERLRQGGWIAALVDRAAEEAEPGALVRIDRGPLLLARRARALVLPGVSWLGADGRLEVRLDAPFSLNPRSGGLALPQALARLQRFFDDHVRAHPTQWFEWRSADGDGAGAAA
jgi:lauroyl/myristoyl acyltransferase